MTGTNPNMWRSLAMSFRIELAFHAANNEGAGGTNVMEPRRITVGDKEYDGISGEIIRRHILQNFVKLCQQTNVPLHNRCKGLVPDRGRDYLIQWIINNRNLPTRDNKPLLDPEHYPDATEAMIRSCAVCDVGGYLIPFEQNDPVRGNLKRDSCFEVGWLITEHPAIVDYTQHSAYKTDIDPKTGELQHNLFVQNMRVGIYGGVLRIDLDRIGRNDWWWLNPKKGEGTKIDAIEVSNEDIKKLNKNEIPDAMSEKLKEILQTEIEDIYLNKFAEDRWRVIVKKEKELIIKQEDGKLSIYEPYGFEEYAIEEKERLKRACLLLEAIKKWLLSPSFAKQTGWLQHQDGLLEGSIVLSKDGAAPFVSPLKLEIDDERPFIMRNKNYRNILQDIVTQAPTHYNKYDFNSPKELIEKIEEILRELGCRESR